MFAEFTNVLILFFVLRFKCFPRNIDCLVFKVCQELARFMKENQKDAQTLAGNEVTKIITDSKFPKEYI